MKLKQLKHFNCVNISIKSFLLKFYQSHITYDDSLLCGKFLKPLNVCKKLFLCTCNIWLPVCCLC